MADNVAITAGSGTDVATDQVTGTLEHVQLFKLAIATDGSRTLVPADGTDGLLVNLGTNNDVAVTGSVTANAGTNLNTSTLAIETGGNLATAATLLGTIDADTSTLAGAVSGTEFQVDVITAPGTAAEAAALPAVFVVVAGDDGVDTQPIQLSATGDLKVTLDSETVQLAAGSASIGILGANSGVDIGDVTINNATGAAAVNIQDGGNAITVDNGGTFAVQAAQSGTWTVQPGNTANTTPWLVTQTPATSGGLTTYHLISAATTNATNIKASAGQVYGWYIQNNNAAMRKVAFHNSASAPTAGASVFFSLSIPASSAANISFPNGIPFSSGIGITTVTEQADSGTTAVASGDLNINIFYK